MSYSPTGPDAELAGAVLTIDLDVICENYARATRAARTAECAAVVKADAYGCGQDYVAPALADAGCKTFFVAHLGEAIALREILPDVKIMVLNGLIPGTAAHFAANRIKPVLNTLRQIEEWAGFCTDQGKKLAAALHIDTGMSRLGLTPDEVRLLIKAPEALGKFDLDLIMTHLACGDVPGDSKNRAQLDLFNDLRALLPDVPASFSNSAATFSSTELHFDLVRPGIALFGGNPFANQPSPVKQAVRLDTRILQVRSIANPETVGYGALWQAQAPSRIATVATGYADGYPRLLSNRSAGFIAGERVPLVGNVSMDLIGFDVTKVDDNWTKEGMTIEMLGPHISVDEIAAAAETIPYEILTGLGRRYARHYIRNGQTFSL